MAHDTGKQAALGRVLVALSALAWSTAGIFTKGVEADVWTVLLWRGLLAGGVMSAWLVWRRGQAGLAEWKHLGWAGWSAATVSSAATICSIAAFKNTAVANVAIIYATAPFAAAAIAWVWMRETPGLATLAAAGLCLAGVTVMVGGSAGSPDLIGDLLALGMTALMALMMVIMQRHPDRPMTLAVGPVSCLQLVAIGWVMSAQLDVSARELVLLAGFGVVTAASRARRLAAEQRLKAGELKALVATASLELGIDIGDVDLVCQLGSTRSISTFLQRAGRSGHAVHGTPKGRLFPLTRDELVECAAILDAVRRGELDTLHVPVHPLDVLAQQVVAMVAAEDWSEDALLATVHRAWPYRNLDRERWRQLLAMLAGGFATRRGRRSAYLHRDVVNGELRARRGARLTAMTSGGAIPDNADYDVVLEPHGTRLGSVNEDFAIESLPGDIFQLGNTSWRILRIERSSVRVEDAHGQPPNLPFWLGEAPGRTGELSDSVCDLLGWLARRFEAAGACATDGDVRTRFVHELVERIGVGTDAAEQIVDYLCTAHAALGALPDRDTVVLERFFDESGGMQLVIHSRFGSRLNRAWGLALRKRFCRKFNFELQAAATEDAIVLSLGESDSFALDEVARYLSPETVRDVLTQALLDAPMFDVRWRWNANVSLAIPRFRGGAKVPPNIQRMQAEDLVAAVFPDQIACAENLAGPHAIPDHPLVEQTIADALTETMDIEGLETLVTRLRDGEIRVVSRDLTEPSPLAAEVLDARPYAFLDDAPLEERRTRAVSMRRGLDPASAADIGRLDADAIDRVCDEAWPDAANPDEVHDALVVLGFATTAEAIAGRGADPADVARKLASGERSGWSAHLDALVASGRATRFRTPGGGPVLWCAAERLAEIEAALGGGRADPPLALPEELRTASGRDAALAELLRARLGCLGPVTAARLASDLGLTAVERRGRARRAGGRGLRAPRAVHARCRFHGMVRAAPARPHPPLHARPAAA